MKFTNKRSINNFNTWWLNHIYFIIEKTITIEGDVGGDKKSIDKRAVECTEEGAVVAGSWVYEIVGIIYEITG